MCSLSCCSLCYNNSWKNKIPSACAVRQAIQSRRGAVFRKLLLLWSDTWGHRLSRCCLCTSFSHFRVKRCWTHCEHELRCMFVVCELVALSCAPMCGWILSSRQGASIGATIIARPSLIADVHEKRQFVEEGGGGFSAVGNYVTNSQLLPFLLSLYESCRQWLMN